MQYQETSNNKLRGVTVSRNGERTFYALISIPLDLKRAGPSQEALEYVYADALQSGCGKYTRQTFLDALSLIGGSITVDIHDGILTFSLLCLEEHHAQLLKLFSTMFENPSFLQKEIARIIVQTTNELTEAKENAKVRSLDNIANEMYQHDDRRFTYFGDELITAVKAVRRTDIQKLHTYVRTCTWTYTLACDSKSIKGTLLKFTKLSGTTTSAHEVITPPAREKGTQLLLTPIPSKQNIELNIGAPCTLTLADPEYQAFAFGLAVLGKWGGFSGRLMSTVREIDGLTYGIYAKLEGATISETGYWRIMTFFSPEKVEQGIAATLKQVSLIQSKGITKKEFERFKVILNTEKILLQDSIRKNVLMIHSFLLRGFTYDQIDAFKERMQHITVKEINAALKKHIKLDSLVISAAGPVAQKETQLRALTDLAKVIK